jgi:internalin A
MLRNILPDYAPPHRALIMTLLRKFELCYPESDSAWWFPNLMPQDEPAETDGWEDALHFEYEYPELPESIITRFIVRAHEWIDAGKVWRWGVILANSSNRALVRAGVPEKKVEIRVAGQENTRVHFLAQIRGHFDSIHKTFTEGKEKAQFSIEAFLLPAKYPGLRISYDDLLTFERKGVAEIPQNWQGEVVTINVSEILNGFVPPAEREKERKRRAEEEGMEGRSIIIHGNVIGSALVQGNENSVQQQIEHSFNTPSNPALAPLLAELTEAVKALLPKLDEETAEEAREDLTRLQEELQKEKPKRKWYSVSIEGLKAAAQNMGDIGAPVLKLAGDILKILG